MRTGEVGLMDNCRLSIKTAADCLLPGSLLLLFKERMSFFLGDVFLPATVFAVLL